MLNVWPKLILFNLLKLSCCFHCDMYLLEFHSPQHQLKKNNKCDLFLYSYIYSYNMVSTYYSAELPPVWKLLAQLTSRHHPVQHSRTSHASLPYISKNFFRLLGLSVYPVLSCLSCPVLSGLVLFSTVFGRCFGDDQWVGSLCWSFAPNSWSAITGGFCT